MLCESGLSKIPEGYENVHDMTVFRGGKTDQKKEDWDKDSLYFLMEKVLGKKTKHQNLVGQKSQTSAQ